MRLSISCRSLKAASIASELEEALPTIEGVEFTATEATYRTDPIVLSALITGGAAVLGAVATGIFGILQKRQSEHPASMILIIKGREPLELTPSNLDAKLKELKESDELLKATDILL